MRKRITNKVVDEKISSRNIRRLDDFINSNTKIRWQCLNEECGHVWITAPKNVIHAGTGCPKCAKYNNKLNNEIIDSRLIGLNIPIKRLDSYINYVTQIKWKCNFCAHVWKTAPGHILHEKTGCPKCKGGVKYNNEIIDDKLSDRKIKRLGEYMNNSSKIEWQCLENNCNYKWLATYASISVSKFGCPACSGTLELNNEIVDARISFKNIKRLDDVTKSHDKIRWQCLKNECGYIWTATIDNVTRRSSCPSCADTRLTNEIVDRRITGRGIKRVGNYINISTNIEWKCLNRQCNYVWLARPGAILNNETGCPSCGRTNERIVFDTLTFLNIDFDYHKNIRKINSEESKKYIVDFYLPKHDIIIEYNGAQHYGPIQFGGCSLETATNNFKRQIKRDKYIRKFCKKNKIELIEIDGRKLVKSSLEEYIVKLFK